MNRFRDAICSYCTMYAECITCNECDTVICYGDTTQIEGSRDIVIEGCLEKEKVMQLSQAFLCNNCCMSRKIPRMVIDHFLSCPLMITNYMKAGVHMPFPA